MSRKGQSGKLVEEIASIPARVRLALAEIKAGVTLIEAVKSDTFETNLRRLLVSEEDREEVRQIALIAAQAGMDAELFQKVLMWYARQSLESLRTGVSGFADAGYEDE